MNLEIKGYLHQFVEDITVLSPKGGKGAYVCPICGSGQGKNKTGAFFLKDDKSWKCFSCERSGDVLDLIGYIEEIDSYKDKLRRAQEIFNLKDKREQRNEAVNSIPLHYSLTKKEEVNYSKFFQESQLHLRDTDYFEKRGLSLKTVQQFGVGFVKSWKHSTIFNSNVPVTPRLIIPISETSYFARDTRCSLPNSQQAYVKQKVGENDLFNKKELLENRPDPVFIVEGEIDAMSVVEVGGRAVALGGVGNINKLLKFLDGKKINRTLILSLDNDKIGQQAQLKLAEQLESKKVKFIIFNLTKNQSKDPNEMLVTNKGEFKKMVEEAINKTKSVEEKYAELKTNNFIKPFVEGIKDSVNTPYIKTNFTKLDDLLDGGLYEGLYCVVAISSLGKTTLVTQIADQIAQQGVDVLIFSLEMARFEIMSKSISRHTIKEVLETGGDVGIAKTARGITTGSRYAKYSLAEKELIKKAISNYNFYSKNIIIVEGIGNVNVNYIRKTVQIHMNCFGSTPVVIIDYLKILAPLNERATDKQNNDKSVLELKRISRDFKIPVIAISSFNRENYKTSVSMQSFKESGAIEYSSDVLIGLQLKGLGEEGFDIDEAKSKEPRDIELVILKNQNGKTGLKMELKYYPQFNFFKE